MRRVVVRGLAIAAQLALVACGREAGSLGPEPAPRPDVSAASVPAAAGLEAGATPLVTNALVDVADYTFDPNESKISQAGTVDWHFHGPSNHTATDNSGMKLWDSGSRGEGQTFAFVFTAAGIYRYRCDIHHFMQGKVKVPVKVKPTSGGTSTTFTVTWASAAPAADYVFDVQIRRPGSASFVDFLTGVTSRSATFVPDTGTGIYSFRSRLRNTAKAKSSNYSAPKKITVS
jgi:plastocyanin